MFKIFLSFLFIFCKVLCGAYEEQTTVSKENYFSKADFAEYGVKELILKNGFKVILKPIHAEPSEILAHICAQGGYASFPYSKRACGELSPLIVLESGLGNLTSDQLSVLLYEYSIEFNPKMEAFCRFIEGTAEDEEGLDVFLQLVHLYFTQPKFTSDALEVVIRHFKENNQRRPADFETTYEDYFMRFNTQNLKDLLPLTLSEAQSTDLAKSKECFEQAFSNPSEFVCVIVGDFNPDRVMHSLTKYLASIPSQNKSFPLTRKGCSFPKGISHKMVTQNRRTECLTRMTFPLQIKVEENKISQLELLCQLIEYRLKKILNPPHISTLKSLNVSYALPIYPHLDSSWITIQFVSESLQDVIIENTILSDLKKLQNEGPISQELIFAKTVQKQREECKLHDNYYWLLVLSNSHLWKQDLRNFLQQRKDISNLKLEEMHQLICSSLNLNHYSVISSRPTLK